MTYCWWTKSWTTKDDNHPIIYRVLTIPGGAGFRPSTVSVISHLRCFEEDQSTTDAIISKGAADEKIHRPPIWPTMKTLENFPVVFPRERPFWRNLAKRIDTVCVCIYIYIYIFVYTEFQEIRISKKSKVKQFTILRCVFLETWTRIAPQIALTVMIQDLIDTPFAPHSSLPSVRTSGLHRSFDSHRVKSQGWRHTFRQPWRSFYSQRKTLHPDHVGNPSMTYMYCINTFQVSPLQKKQTNSLQNLRWLHHEANHIII